MCSLNHSDYNDNELANTKSRLHKKKSARVGQRLFLGIIYRYHNPFSWNTPCLRSFSDCLLPFSLSSSVDIMPVRNEEKLHTIFYFDMVSPHICSMILQKIISSNAVGYYFQLWILLNTVFTVFLISSSFITC